MTTSLWFVPIPRAHETRIDPGLASLINDRYGPRVTLEGLGGETLDERIIGWLDGVIAATGDIAVAHSAIELRAAIRKHGAVRLMVER